MFCANCGTKLNGMFCSGCGGRANEQRIANPYQGKNLQLCGVVAALVGLILMAATWPGNFDESFVGLTVGGALTVAGATVALAGKAKHWYHAE